MNNLLSDNNLFIRHNQIIPNILYTRTSNTNNIILPIPIIKTVVNDLVKPLPPVVETTSVISSSIDLSSHIGPTGPSSSDLINSPTGPPAPTIHPLHTNKNWRSEKAFVRFSDYYKRRSKRARVWPLEFKLIDPKIKLGKRGYPDDFDEFISDNKFKIVEFIKNNWPGEEIKRGDLIVFREIADHEDNDGVAMIGKKKSTDELIARTLSTKYHEDGHIPENYFAITDFGIHYWKELILCNEIIWLDNVIWDKIKLSEIYYYYEMINGEKVYKPYFKFEYDDRTYRVKFDKESYLDGDEDDLFEAVAKSNDKTYASWDKEENSTIRIGLATE